MIERVTIEGRKALVAYLDGEFNPVEQDDADLIKVIFDDGEIRFAVPVEKDDEDDDEAKDAEFREEQHKRDKGGEFTSGGGGGGGAAKPHPLAHLPSLPKYSARQIEGMVDKAAATHQKFVVQRRPLYNQLGPDMPPDVRKQFDAVSHMESAAHFVSSAIDDALRNPHKIFSASVVDGEPAAAGILDPKKGVIELLGSVARGHGAVVLADMLRKAQAAGLRQVRLEATDAASAGFYQHVGFVPRSRRVLEDGGWMTADLSKLNLRQPAAGHDEALYPSALDAEFKEEEHPRGQPDNAGQFVAAGEGGAGGATEPAEGPEEEPATPPAPRVRLRRPGAAPEPAKPARARKEPPRPEQTFISPNTGELSFTGAQHELAGRRQKLLNEVAAAIDTRLGLKRVTSADVIGAWTDGAENALMQTYAKSADPKMVRVAAAIKASIAQQKSALIFQPHDEGEGVMLVFEDKGSLADIHDRLLKEGVQNHTLQSMADGARVHVYASDQETVDAVGRAAEAAGVDYEFIPGDGEYIGSDYDDPGTDDEQRANAHDAYQKIMEEFAAGTGGQKVRDVWSDAHNHWRAATGTDEGIGLVGSQGDAGLISTRRPHAVGALESDRYRRIDLDAEKEDPEVFQDHTDRLKIVRDYPNLRPSEVEGKTPDQIADSFIAHIKSNLRFLYDHAPKEMRDRAHLWYEGAHDIAADMAKQHHLPLSSVAGVYAALSPQKLWDMNVYLGNRLIEIHQTQQNHTWDDDMSETATNIWLPKTPPVGDRAIENLARKERILDLIRGQTLASLDDKIEDPKERLIAKAMWIRTYDEAHSDRHFDRLTPDGKSMGIYRNKKTPKQVREGQEGNPAKAAWQSLPSLSSAIKALESNGDRITISEAMGTQHKVRSFYNNILDPHSANEDVTMDTHAIGAALLRPLSGADIPVMHSLATSPATGEIARRIGYSKPREQSKLGINGTYAIYAEAYRELAHELSRELKRDIEPRELQSVTWEAKRAMFDNSTTDRQARLAGQAWRNYHNGRADLATTQRRILRIAGGFKRLEDIQDTHD